MKSQLLFAFRDMKRNKVYYLRFFVQFICILLLSGICVSQFSSLYEFKSRFDIFDDLSEIYVMRDKTDDEVFVNRSNEEDFFEKVYGFYKELTALDGVELLAYDEQFVPVRSNESLDIAYVADPYGEKYYPLLYIEQSFADIFDLSVTKGRVFTKEEYEKEEKLTPVLLGYRYKEYYDVGTVIDDAYYVAGILEKDAFYLDPGKEGSVIYLENSMVAPMVVNQNTDPLVLSNMVGFGTIVTKDSTVLADIADRAGAIGLFDDMEFISYKQQLATIIQDAMLWISIGAIVMCIVLFFCLVCLITSMMNYIDVHRAELAVHLLCGATQADLIIRLAVPIAAMLLLSDGIAAYLIKEPATVGILLVFSVVLLAGVLLLPMIKIKRKNVAGFLREDQHD